MNIVNRILRHVRVIFSAIKSEPLVDTPNLKMLSSVKVTTVLIAT